MEFIRQWKVGDETFASKREAQEHEALTTLNGYVGQGNAVELIANADRVVELLKPFTTPKRRAPKGNGKAKAAAKPKPFPTEQPPA